MRIQRIEIEKWRHFRNVSFVVPEDTPIVCLVGGNGTGKSQVLELIASCAEHVGLSPGSENPRGNPFAENASFEVTFFIAKNSISALDHIANFQVDHFESAYHAWDRTLRVSSSAQGHGYVKAGGVLDAHSSQFAQHVIRIIQQSQSIHYLSLDADRAYPKLNIAAHQLSEVYDRDWESTNKQSSFRITYNLYEEWFKYLIGRENQENNKHIQEVRLARNAGMPDPIFKDNLASYKDAVKKVLPHLLFTGVDPQARQIKFDSTGVPLTFNQLSGGEREIAFLVGQIERFGLKKGLLLVDEPELHLNYDLLRVWIGFLKDSVQEGQIWLATHSLEVVEVAGQEATIVLYRDDQSRHVTGAVPLSRQPVVATLSRAIGSPAFSISNLAFVMIEGEEEIGERERFRLLCNIPPHVRFLEAGSCKEVARRVENLKDLAAVSGQVLRIGGVVDQDWRSKQYQNELVGKGLFVLGVHEVENFFLHPPTLQNFLQTNGGDPKLIEPLLVSASDKRAFSWVFNAARTDQKFRDYPEPSKELRERVHSLHWNDSANLDHVCDELSLLHGGLNKAEIGLLKTHLIARAKIYNRKREEGNIWRICEGKEVFRSIITDLGLSDEDAGERAIAAVWVREPTLIPSELVALRGYIRAL